MGDKEKFRIKKDYPLKLQERDNYCLCSVLQSILRRHGVSFSQREIADSLTPSENGLISHDDKIKEFHRSKGFEYSHYWHNETPFNEPDMVLSDMHDNDGLVGIGSHVYLLKYFDDPVLELIDPKGGGVIKKDIYQLLREMEKSGGFFGLVKRLK